MFDLMIGVDVLPTPEEMIFQVHKGMNKLRVSVGEHVSEPSEVYIITGEESGLFNTFIVFFMVEPGIHVIYGFDDNPYDPSLREEVLNMAIDFVEDMGAILEEIPWEGMTPEERTNWIDKEALYPAAEAEAIEEIEDLEEIEPEDLLAVVEQADDGEKSMDVPSDTGGAEKGVGDVSEELSPEDDVPTEVIEEELPGEDEDFDHLLKQAFLKPDLVRKSSSKKAATREEEPDEEEDPADDETYQDLEGDVEGSASAFTEDAAEEEPEPVLTYEEDSSAVELEPEPITMSQGAMDTPAIGVNQTAVNSDEQTRLTVIKYLSRF